MLYDHQPKEVIEKEISKLIPINHNPYFWWRRWKPKKEILHKRKSLLEKINNGDFDTPHFYWQAQYSLMELNKLYNESSFETFIEKSAVERRRYNRLIDEYYKEEDNRLKQLIFEFTNNFTIRTEEEVEKIILEFGGTIKELYNYFEKNYKFSYGIPSWKRTF